MNAPRCVVLALCLAASLAAPAQIPVGGPTTATTARPGFPGGASYPGGGSTPLGESIAALLAEPSVAREDWGIAVTALDGTPIYGLDEGQLFRPASNAKLFTTTAAMALLGPDSTVATVILFPPTGGDGVVHGDLTLVGHGDANLSGRTLPYMEPSAAKTEPAPAEPLRGVDELADSVVHAGVRHITGDIVASDYPWEPYPQGWGTDDLLWGYGAPVAGLTVDDNEVKVTITGGRVAQPATITATIEPTVAAGSLSQPPTIVLTPDLGYYRIQSTARTADGSQNTIAIHRDPGDRTLYISGLIPADHTYSTELAIDDPPLYAIFALRHELEARGVAVDGKLIATHEFSGNPDDFLHESRMPVQLSPQSGLVQPIADLVSPKPTMLSHTSPTLAEDVIATLKESLNLHAELMLRRLGQRFGNVVGSDSSGLAQGARVERQWLVNAGLDPNDFVFYDGSGLSAKDLVTPRVTAQLLSFAARQPWFAQWKAALPVGGVDGTLSARFKQPPLKGHVFAKTGTLGESRALSGYLDCASGRKVIFSIFSDNHLPGSSADRAAMDKIVAAIAAQE
jgi:D-alanyl-D-alanine carboxypeptidase/D-alanyl-D-alanine-endopeptidase (penicillin-binding protein 4)